MVGVAVNTGSGAGKIAKWFFIFVILLVLILILWVAWNLMEQGASLTDPSTWSAPIVTWFETKFGVYDTGDSKGTALLKAIYFSGIGAGGAFLGIGTSSWGIAGMAESLRKGKSSWYTFFKR